MDITNTATLAYSVSGTPQTPVPSNETSFKVDNKVNVLVAESGGTVTNVAPGAQDQVTTFTVTNNGNTSQGYNLVAAAGTPGLIDGMAGTLTATGITVFVDSNANGIYEPALDTATAIASLASGDSATVFVVADMPTSGGFGTGANGEQAHISLTAITTTVNTITPVIAITGADTAAVDIVFADAATTQSGFVSDNDARDGKGTARDAYRIATAVLTVAKTATLLCDPFNGNTNQKHIPGSIVRYTITISNAAGAPASATLGTISDPLVGTTFEPNLVTGAGAPATPTSCTADGVVESAAGSGFKIDVANSSRSGTSGTFPKFLTNVSTGNDGADFTGTTATINYLQALPAGGSYTAGELKAGESVVVYFNAIIN